MTRLFYPKMAWDNIRKNRRTYLPFMLTSIFTAAMDYVICALANNKGLGGVYGASTVAMILNLGTYVTALFTVIFLFYTNSFLIKRHKKEFGLYNILGMSKRHIAKLIALETLYTFVISTVTGIVFGMILDKLMFLIVSKIVGIEVTLGFYISAAGIEYTVVLFAVVFFLIFLNSLRQIHLSKPVELLHGDKVGEKEPKAKWLIALLGIACLGTGYYIAITTKNPIQAINLFFLAVILVIIGTYLVFTAGSIAILKLLRKNKGYYYKPKHFISVSGMLYRMKQNAVGLANICVLSTMVLVMISSTFSLMVGIDGAIIKNYPYQINVVTDFAIKADIEAGMMNKMREIADTAAKSNNTKVTADKFYSYLGFSITDNGKSLTISSDIDIRKVNEIKVLAVIPLQDYNRIMKTDYQLSQNEVLISGKYNAKEITAGDNITVIGDGYNVKAAVEPLEVANIVSGGVDAIQLIVSDFDVMQKLCDLQAEIYGKNASRISVCYGFDIENAEKEVKTKAAFSKQLDNYFVKSAANSDEIFYSSVSSREEQKAVVTELYGGLLFLGAFLGLMFTIAAALIIYYKQLSEGYDDNKRFEIMQKVGLSDREIKSTIHSQVLTVFFLPLLMAGVHITFAFPMIYRMLLLLQLDNISLFLICTLVCFAVFALIYTMIYAVTAKVYYKVSTARN